MTLGTNHASPASGGSADGTTSRHAMDKASENAHTPAWRVLKRRRRAFELARNG